MQAPRLALVLLMAAGGWAWGRVNWTHVQRRMETMRGTCPNVCDGAVGPSPSELGEKEFLASSCFCDGQCGVYGDCCLDRAQEETARQNWVCEPLASEAEPFHVYMMGSCPVDWLDHQVDDLCRRGVERSAYSFDLDVPVFSEITNITYVNVFCANCHGDTESLMSATVRFNCPLNETNCRATLERSSYYPTLRHWSFKSYGKRSYSWFSLLEHEDPRAFVKQRNVRRCRPVIDNCDRGESDDIATEDLEGCPAFASYTYEWADATMAYKNPLCAVCQDDPPARLECNWTSMPQQHHAKSLRQQFLSTTTQSFIQQLDFAKILSGEDTGTFRKVTEVGHIPPKSNNGTLLFLDLLKAVFRLLLS